MKQVKMTRSQKEIWISSHMGSAPSCACNKSFTIRLHGDIDYKILEKAILLITSRHDALSATFSNDGIYMHKAQLSYVPIKIHDLRNSAYSQDAQYLNQLTEQDASAPFNLENGPLWRAHLVVQSDSDLVLIFTTHLLVCDNMSIYILIREIGTAYDTMRTGQKENLEAYGSFFEYVNAITEKCNEENRNVPIDFWKSECMPPLPTLDLPVDHRRPPEKTYNAISKRCRINQSIVDQITKIAAENECSPFSYFLAAYATFIYKLTGSSDFFVSVPVTVRLLQKDPAIIGNYATMKPVHITISPDTPFNEFASIVYDEMSIRCDHDQLTLSDSGSELNISHDPSGIPLVPIGFSFNNMPASGEFGFDGLYAACSQNSRKFTAFEVYAEVIDCKNSWELLWHFKSDLFDESTAERWLEEYIVLLGGIVDNSRSVLSGLSLLTESERTSIFEKWNSTDRPFNLDETVVTMFEKQAALTPDAVALEFCGSKLTYKELNDKAQRLALYLQTQGAGPDVPVGFCLERSFDMVISVLGILKSGSAYIPIDPSFPDDRISFILKDSGAKILITSPENFIRFPDPGIPIVNPSCISEVQKNKALQQVSGEHCAYIIYTSGSTGKPKGVEIRHFSLANFLISMRESPGMNHNDSLLAITTISFDIACMELLCPLTCGAAVYLAEKKMASDPIQLAGFIREKKPSIMQATPATWTMLIDSGWNNAERMKILCGGEAMTRSLADHLLATGAEVWNMYGPTETTIWSSLWKVTPGTKPPPVGRPIANTRFFILDTRLSPLPIGTAGDLYIGGIGLARSYRNRPDLTTEKFIGNPFHGNMYSGIENRIYKTGDIARWQTDGNIELLGRSDFQVKIRGFRIELGEIENSIKNNLNVSDCSVIVRDQNQSTATIIAFYVPKLNTECTSESIREFLKKQLPDYMIPSQLISISRIPLTINGKIDKNTLLDILKKEHKEIKPPVLIDPTEQIVFDIWCRLLGTSQIDMESNFFDIGGNSLLIVQMSILIKNLLNIDVDIVDLFQNSDISTLSSFLMDKACMKAN